MAISNDKIEHIAKLAKINFLPEEKERFFKEFSQILDFVGKLGKVDTSGGKDFLSGSTQKTARQDQARKKDEKETEKLMANVPRKRGSLIRTKKIF